MLETKGRKTILVSMEDFAALLRMDISKFATDKNRIQARLHGRISGMGLGDVCGRCGGTGHYSFNLMDGTRCFKCAGNRTLLPKLSEAFYEKVKEVIAEGKLDEYLEKLAQRNKLEKAAKILFAICNEKSRLSKDYSAEYDREQREYRAERDRVIEILGTKDAYGSAWGEHFNKAAVTPLNGIIRDLRRKQIDIHDEYRDLETKLRQERKYGVQVSRHGQPLQSDEDRKLCDEIMILKYEDVKARLEKLEADYAHLKAVMKSM